MEHEKLMNSTIKLLKKEYYLIWLLWIVLGVLSEMTTPLSGILAENAQAVYVLETFTILITAGSIPLALKLFSKSISKLKPENSLDEIIQIYIKSSRIRLTILTLVIVLALITSHLCISSSGTLCAILVGFTAFFCAPSLSKLTLVIDTLKPQKNDDEE